MLREAFDTYEVEPIRVLDLVQSAPATVARNLWQVFDQQGVAAFRSAGTLKRQFVRTPFLFAEVSRLADRHLRRSGADYAFSFQLQSLFDTSVEGIPNFVYTDHTHLANTQYPGFDKTKLNRPEWLACERRIYERARKIFTRSSNITASLIRDYGCAPEKVKQVGVGVNVPAPRPGDEARLPGGKKILFVGSDWDRKGGPTLASAFRLVLERHPDAQLTVVGCKPALLPGNTTATGKLPIEAVARHFATANVFCLPTTNEPFGVTLVEAMAYGLPLVATPVGAIPDLLRDGANGLSVPVGDVGALAIALCKMLDDPALAQRYGENSARIVATQYNWRSVGGAIRDEINKELD